MKRHPNLVRALDEQGNEVLVGASFAKSHGLKLVEAPKTPRSTRSKRRKPAKSTTTPAGSDSSASHKEE